MAITFPVVGVGTSGATLSTSFTITIPTVAVDDILFLAITCRDSVGDPIVTDDDAGGNTWAKITSGNNGTSLAAVYWKRATSATSGKTITVEDNAGDATTSICGALGIARGVSTGATPYGNETYETNASTNETHAGFTPGANDAAIVLCVFNATNDIEPSGQTCTDPGALDAYNVYGESTAGSDCSVEIAADVQTTANATGNLTWAQVDAASMSIAFSLTAVVAVPPAPDIASPTITVAEGTYGDGLQLDIPVPAVEGSPVTVTDATDGDGLTLKIPIPPRITEEPVITVVDEGVVFLPFLVPAITDTEATITVADEGTVLLPVLVPLLEEPVITVTDAIETPTISLWPVLDDPVAVTEDAAPLLMFLVPETFDPVTVTENDPPGVVLVGAGEEPPLTIDVASPTLAVTDELDVDMALPALVWDEVQPVTDAATVTMALWPETSDAVTLAEDLVAVVTPLVVDLADAVTVVGDGQAELPSESAEPDVGDAVAAIEVVAVMVGLRIGALDEVILADDGANMSTVVMPAVFDRFGVYEVTDCWVGSTDPLAVMADDDVLVVGGDRERGLGNMLVVVHSGRR